jgi:hypothetical protein
MLREILRSHEKKNEENKILEKKDVCYCFLISNPWFNTSEEETLFVRFHKNIEIPVSNNSTIVHYVRTLSTLKDELLEILNFLMECGMNKEYIIDTMNTFVSISG